MIRQIIKINSDKCNGCELCVNACHEGALGMVNGKAVLLRDDYCDGLGNCLPVCPVNAITFEERDTLAFDEAAVKENSKSVQHETLACGCLGTHAKTIQRTPSIKTQQNREQISNPQMQSSPPAVSQLNQWPVQIKLVPVNAAYFDQANILVSADCAAYAYAGFHNKFMKNCITLIGCPKLDDGDYSEKLTLIIKNNNIKSISVVRMEVPCCKGLENAVKTALMNSGKMIPWQIFTISTDGNILEN